MKTPRCFPCPPCSALACFFALLLLGAGAAAAPAGAPVIGGVPPLGAKLGEAFFFSVTAANSPTSFALVGSLPDGLSFDTTTGVISGSPAKLGTFSLTFTAQNGAGTSDPVSTNLKVVFPGGTWGYDFTAKGLDASVWTTVNPQGTFTFTSTAGAGVVVAGGSASFQTGKLKLNLAQFGALTDFRLAATFKGARMSGGVHQVQLETTFGAQGILLDRSNQSAEGVAGGNSVNADDGTAKSLTPVGADGGTSSQGTLVLTRVGTQLTGYWNGTPFWSGSYSAEPLTDISLALNNNYGATDAAEVTWQSFSLTSPAVSSGWPGIVMAPLSAVSSVGGTVTLRVIANGSPALSYQWMREYMPLTDGTQSGLATVSGAKTPVLTLAGVQAGDAAVYRVQVRNPVGSINSPGAAVTVGSSGVVPTFEPSFVSGQSVVAGANVTFAFPVVGSPPMSFQWKKNDTDIAGATSPALNLTSAQVADAGTYVLTVTNGYASVTSQPMLLTVASARPGNDNFAQAATLGSLPASIAGTNIGASSEPGEPSHDPHAESSAAAMGMSAAGGYTVWYQWTAPQSGAYRLELAAPMSGSWFDPIIGIYTGSSLATLAKVWVGAGPRVDFFAAAGTTYRFVVDGGFGTTSEFTLNLSTAVGEAPTLAYPMDAMGVMTGQDAYFYVGAFGTQPLRYVWKKGTEVLADGARISGARTSMFRLGAAQPADAGEYSVTVTNDLGSITAGTTLTVGDPVIAQQPQSRAATAGEYVTIYAYAQGTPPLTYQWKKGDANVTDANGIVGATSPMLTFSAVRAADAGSYSLLVTNGNNASVTSAAAVLTVSAPTSVPVISSPAQATAAPGVSFTYTITASNSPTTFAASGLPEGLTLNPTSGVISGVPAAAGTSTVSLTASNSSGVGPSFSLALAVVAPTAPVFTTTPFSQAVPVGGSVTFSAEATGSGELTYEWRCDGSIVATGTTPFLALTNVQPASKGAYTVTVRNGVGSVTSAPAYLFVGAPGPVISFAAGADHTLFVTNDGTLWGCGNNLSGQLSSAASRTQATPVPLAFGVQSVAAGLWHTLFLKTDGTLWSMGHNPSGALGDGTTMSRGVPYQVATQVARMAGGFFHSVYGKTDGTLWAMGDNSSGQLGDGTTTDRLSPVQVAGVSDVAAVTAGNWHTLFLKTNGTLWGMGANDSGQLADGTTTNRSSPTQVNTSVAAVSAGWFYTLLVKNDGTLLAVGNNEFGQLGDGSLVTRTVPVTVATGVSKVSAWFNHSAFLKADGSLWTMGVNDHGQLGDGLLSASRSTPARVATDVDRVAVGHRHTLWTFTNGSLWGVGGNGTSQLGLPSSPPQTTPLALVSVPLPALGVASVTPNPAAPGDKLTVTGAGFPFGGVPAVTLGSAALSQVKVLSPSRLIATLPPSGVASGNLTVALGSGQSAFTYLNLTGGTSNPDFGYTATVRSWASDGSKLAAVVNGVNYYAWTSITSGLGTTPGAYPDWATLRNFTGLPSLAAETSVTFKFGDMVLGTFVSGQTAPDGLTVQTYVPAAGGTPVKFYDSGGKVLAEGRVEVLGIKLPFSTGVATGRGSFVLTTAGDSPKAAAFLEDVNSRTFGTGRLTFTIDSYSALGAQGVYFDYRSGGVILAGAGTTAQTITFGAIPAKTYQDQPFAVGATASSGLPVTVAVVAGPASVAVVNNVPTVTLNGAGTVTLRALQPGSATYAPADSVDQTFTVAKATPVLTWSPPTSVPVGTALGAAHLNASAVPGGGSFLYTPASGATLSAIGTQTLSVTYTPAPADAANYQPATATRDISVVGSSTAQTITFPAIAAKTYGEVPFALSASASSGLTVSFSVLSGPATISGSTLTITGAGTVAVKAAQAGNGTYAAAPEVTQSFTVAKATPVLTWPTPAAIFQGTALSATQLNATASVPGNFLYTPAAGVVLAAGSQTLGVTFTPTDTGNYTAATASVAISVTASGPAPTITSQPANKVALVGATVRLTVAATGTGTLTYQWKKGGVDLPGATDATLTLSDLKTTDAGSYTGVVSNAGASATSSPASVVVIDAQATHALVGGGYAAGNTVTVSNTVAFTSAAATLGWQVVLPSGWSYASGGGNEGDVKPRVGDVELLEWAWTSTPPKPLNFTYTVNVPAGTKGDQQIAALVLYRQSGAYVEFLAKPDPLVVPELKNHSADSNADYKISLFELTRVIELFNTRNGTSRSGAYRVDAAGEDGFNPEPTRLATATVTLARYHSGDSNRDGKFSLFELTRVIELFNHRSGTSRTGQYHVQPGTEDGFAPGP